MVRTGLSCSRPVYVSSLTEVAHEAELEFRRNDPEAKALREELAKMVTNLARTMKTEKELATDPRHSGESRNPA